VESGMKSRLKSATVVGRTQKLNLNSSSGLVKNDLILGDINSIYVTPGGQY